MMSLLLVLALGILFFANSQNMLTELFLIYISPGTSFFHNNGMEGEVMGLRPTGCACNLPIKKCIYFQEFWVKLLKEPF